MKSTKFHTADENSLGRFVDINKSIRAPPRPQSHEQRQVSVILGGLGREIIERDFEVHESPTRRKVVSVVHRMLRIRTEDRDSRFP